MCFCVILIQGSQASQASSPYQWPVGAISDEESGVTVGEWSPVGPHGATTILSQKAG